MKGTAHAPLSLLKGVPKNTLIPFAISIIKPDINFHSGVLDCQKPLQFKNNIAQLDLIVFLLLAFIIHMHISTTEATG